MEAITITCTEATWHPAPHWHWQCSICLQRIDRGEIIADAGPRGPLHQRCFEAFYEADQP